jgi:hypothetical protein
MFIGVGSEVNVQRLLLLVCELAFKQLFLVKLSSSCSRKASFGLRSLSSNLNFAVTLSFQLLLSLSSWSNDLAYKIDKGVITLRNKDLSDFFGWFVIWRCFVFAIHGKNFSNQAMPLLDILLLIPLLPRIRSLACLGIINRRWTRFS